MANNGSGVPVLPGVINLGTGAVAGITGAALAPGALTAGALAVPLIGVAIAGVALAIGLWMNRLGPKQKIATTKIAEEAIGLWQDNLSAWENSNKTTAEQQQCIANFWNIYNSWVSACSADQMGEPGHRCLEERLPAGFVLNANGNTYTGNGRFGSVFAAFLDPIQNDVVNASFLGTALVGDTGLWLGGLALLAGGLFLMSGNEG